MQAIVYYKYGSPDVLQFAEVDKPVPKENEILLKVYATGLNAADWRLMRASPFLVRLMFGLFKPRINILGADVAGRVEAVGSNVKRFKPGDEVFGDISTSGFGGLAEYVCTQENALAKKPTTMSFREAACVPLAAVTALRALRDVGKITKGKKVLIYGASGGVGTFAIQIAKAFGAEVTAVCSTSKMEMVRALGADHVVDYTHEDFTKNGQLYDVIAAVNGYRSISDYMRSLNTNGIYVMVGGSGAQLFQAMLLGPLISMTSNKKVSNVNWQPNQKDLNDVKDLVEKGVIKSVIEKVYTLAETPEAIRYLEAGHAKGKIVVAIGE